MSLINWLTAMCHQSRRQSSICSQNSNNQRIFIFIPTWTREPKRRGASEDVSVLARSAGAPSRRLVTELKSRAPSKPSKDPTKLIPDERWSRKESFFESVENFSSKQVKVRELVSLKPSQRFIVLLGSVTGTQFPSKRFWAKNVWKHQNVCRFRWWKREKNVFLFNFSR